MNENSFNTPNNNITNDISNQNINHSIINNQNNNTYDNPFATLKPSEYKRPEPHKFFTYFQDNFPFFIKASLLYALVYAICRYDNKRGITTPILAVFSLFFFKTLFKKIGIEIKKITYFYLAAAIALGVNCFMSDDTFIVNTNFWASLLLFAAFFVHNAYDSENWPFGEHVRAILESVVGILPHMFMQINDRAKYNETHNVDKNADKDGKSTKVHIFVGILISIALLIVILPLLASADKFFSEALGNFFEKIFDIFDLFDNESNHTILKFTGYTFFLFLVIYGIIRKLCVHNINVNTTEKEKMSAAIAITVNSVLGVVYVIFSGFQIFYLFLGKMTLPEYATFAEYAHEGFFQLVVVCLINMIMVLIFLACFENTLPLKISLTVISACTYIMMASSTLRMIMYVKAYDLTYLRLFVFWALIVIFMIMNGIVIYTFKKNFPMFRYGIAVLTILYLCFAYSNPTYIITKHNIEMGYTLNADGTYSTDADLHYLKRIYNSESAAAICELSIKYNDPKLFGTFYPFHKVSMDDFNSDFRKFNLKELEEYLTVKKCSERFFGVSNNSH